MGIWRELHDEKLHNQFSSSNNKTKKIRWIEKMKDGYIILPCLR
jgi:hypothetical protein